MSKQDIIENAIEYRFSDKSLLQNALTHSSYAHEHGMSYSSNNERLEFLGDAVLELVSSRYIFEKYPDMPEGRMTKLRAALVCEESLAEGARMLELGDHILLSHGEQQTGGAKRDSILSDAMEAIIGAMYLDGGLEPAAKFISKYVLVDIERKEMMFDPKSLLQEIIQNKYHENTRIEYTVIDERGPAHDKSFTVECIIQGQKYCSGTGPTKKKAEAKAAYETILNIRKQQNT